MTLDTFARIYEWTAITIIAIVVLAPLWVLCALLWHRHAMRRLVAVVVFFALILTVPPVIAAALPADPNASEVLPSRARALFVFAATLLIADILALGAILATLFAIPSNPVTPTHHPES